MCIRDRSTGRLWLCDLFPDAPVLFVSSRRGLTQVPEYFEQALRQLGIRNPVELICQSVQVEKLVVGEEQCNLHRRPSVLPYFSAWLRTHRPARPLETGLRLYVSRAKLSLANGQFLQETVLEAVSYTHLPPPVLRQRQAAAGGQPVRQQPAVMRQIEIRALRPHRQPRGRDLRPMLQRRARRAKT